MDQINKKKAKRQIVIGILGLVLWASIVINHYAPELANHR